MALLNDCMIFSSTLSSFKMWVKSESIKTSPPTPLLQGEGGGFTHNFSLDALVVRSQELVVSSQELVVRSQ